MRAARLRRQMRLDGSARRSAVRQSAGWPRRPPDFRNDLIPSGKTSLPESPAKGIDYAVRNGSREGDGATTGSIVIIIVPAMAGRSSTRKPGNGTFRNARPRNPAIILRKSGVRGRRLFDTTAMGIRPDHPELSRLSTSDTKRCSRLPASDVLRAKVIRNVAQLFHNEGRPFRRCDAEVRPAIGIGTGAGVAVFDADGEGWPDISGRQRCERESSLDNRRQTVLLSSARWSQESLTGEEGVQRGHGRLPSAITTTMAPKDMLVLNLMRGRRGRGSHARAREFS